MYVIVSSMSGSEPEADVSLPGVWEAPPITKEWHDNWEGFKGYMAEYQADTHQVFRLRSFTSVNHRNKEIKTAD
ncbi:hypothetical protein PHMEG_0007889 [Phytophthora megakarya]|uniref:Uncharacterized protein n=1 Tax=Phytophthora megakarya TaxID=4795 RepID=A0A225WKY4_9STRA|nr:hypothetical protein PHMEG_0007889 [Phytophthora megakarya]